MPKRVKSLQFPPYLREVPEIFSNFDIIKVLGQGTYGVVFLSKLKQCHTFRQKYAMKFIIPSSPKSANSELKSLQVLGKHPNVIELLSSVRYLDQVVLMFPFFKHEQFTDLLGLADLFDICYYMHNLLKGLAYIHSKGIIHRDIKPANYLYNSNDRIGKIIDFGLSIASTGEGPSNNSTVFKKPTVGTKRKLYAPTPVCSHNSASVCSTCMSQKVKRVPRAGTPGFRAPEVLFCSKQQTSAIDVWSAGVILLSFLSKCYPFFHAKSDLHALAEIISIFGSRECINVADKLGITITSSENICGCGIEVFCNRIWRHNNDNGLLDQLIALVKNLLNIDPFSRISAVSSLDSDVFNYCNSVDFDRYVGSMCIGLVGLCDIHK